MRIYGMMILLLLAAYQDIRERKIKNRLILTGLAVILVYRYMAEGRVGLARAGIACIITIGVFFPLFLIRAFGAGDIKLFSLVSAVLEPGEAIQVCILWFLLAGVVSLWKLLSKHRLQERMAYVWMYLKSGRATHMPYYDRQRDGTKDIIPLAPFLAVAYGLDAFGRWKGLW